MPRQRRPHPRSLDAIFPRPKKPAAKFCPAGHRQSASWKAGRPCSACQSDERARLRALGADAEREEWSRRNPCPRELTILVVSTGRVKRFSIPRRRAR